MADTKLYVGNLPYSVTADKLSELFAPHGQVVSSIVISDKQTGRSKGFGFVEFASEAEANAAIEALHGQEIDGRTLVVNVARPLQPRPAFQNNRRPRY
jgi:cold-inducible RNA-binding protein